MAFSDGPTGVRGVEFSGGPRASLLPNATLLASSWSEEVAHEVGALLAEEAERQHIHVVLGPTINLHRIPARRPALRGLLRGPAAHRPARRGVRARPAGARHRRLPQAPGRQRGRDRAAHRRTASSTSGRCASSTCCRSRSPSQDADPWSVMAAYNDVNGVPATEQDDDQQRHPQAGVGLERSADVGLVRHQVRRRRPRTAGSTWSCPARTVRGATRWSTAVESGEVARARSSTTTCAGCCGSRPGSARSASPATWPHRAGRARRATYAASSCATWPPRA